MQAQSVPSNALTVISHEDLAKIKGYGLEISEKASEVFDSIHAFVRWISSLQRSAQWCNAAALEFSHSLRQSRNGQSQKHIRALENVVWQVTLLRVSALPSGAIKIAHGDIGIAFNFGHFEQAARKVNELYFRRLD